MYDAEIEQFAHHEKFYGTGFMIKEKKVICPNYAKRKIRVVWEFLAPLLLPLPLTCTENVVLISLPSGGASVMLAVGASVTSVGGTSVMLVGGASVMLGASVTSVGGTSVMLVGGASVAI